jgi:hypothetical protein
MMRVLLGTASVVVGLSAVSATAAAAAATDPFQPLAFLVGHCWKGTLGDGKATDEHCFSWVYDHRFVRDRHVVRAPGRPEQLGETIYLWNSSERRLEYLYIESAGGFSHGTVAADGASLSFPPASLIEDGVAQSYRSRWQKDGSDAYEVVTEFQSPQGWMPRLKVRMQKEPQ